MLCIYSRVSIVAFCSYFVLYAFRHPTGFIQLVSPVPIMDCWLLRTTKFWIQKLVLHFMGIPPTVHTGWPFMYVWSCVEGYPASQIFMTIRVHTLFTRKLCFRLVCFLATRGSDAFKIGLRAHYSSSRGWAVRGIQAGGKQTHPCFRVVWSFCALHNMDARTGVEMTFRPNRKCGLECRRYLHFLVVELGGF